MGVDEIHDNELVHMMESVDCPTQCFALLCERDVCAACDKTSRTIARSFSVLGRITGPHVFLVYSITCDGESGRAFRDTARGL